MSLETEVDAEMLASSVSILLKFHKRVQKKNFPCDVGRIGGSPVNLARVFLFPINYLRLGHYRCLARNHPAANIRIDCDSSRCPGFTKPIPS